MRRLSIPGVQLAPLTSSSVERRVTRFLSKVVEGLVWQRAPYRGEVLLVLLALADWSDDEGYCWPKVMKLALKSRTGRSTAQRALAKLEEDGMIEILTRSRGGIGRKVTEKRKQKRIGHEIVINVFKLRSLPLLDGSEPTAPRRGSRASDDQIRDEAVGDYATAPQRDSQEIGDWRRSESGDDSATVPVRGSNGENETISTTAPLRGSEDFHNWPAEDITTAPPAIESDPSLHLSPHTPLLPSYPLQPSGDPSVAAAAVVAPEQNPRWTLRDDDDGVFDVSGVIVGYQLATGNQPGDADRQAAEALGELPFSMVAMGELMEAINGRAPARVRSLAYFEPGIREVAMRCEKAVAQQAGLMVGASAEDRRRIETGIVRRTVEAWRNGGKR
jgi:hypothetical protein